MTMFNSNRKSVIYFRNMWGHFTVDNFSSDPVFFEGLGYRLVARGNKRIDTRIPELASESAMMIPGTYAEMHEDYD